MTPYGTTASGAAVHAVQIAAGDLTVTLLTYGAILNAVHLAGVPHNLTLNAATLADYERHAPYHGSVIGPVVNRLSGAQAPIGGVMHRFDANQDGRITAHSGSACTAAKVWEVIGHSATHVQMMLELPDGEGGFPGNRRITARFEIIPPATLRMTLMGASDARTLMNFANHSYWRLDDTQIFAGQMLWIDADHFLPTTPDVTPTGEIADVAGTPFDFRTARVLTPGTPPLDTNFCLSQSDMPLRDVLRLSGVEVDMTVATTAAGLQLYDGRPHYPALAIEAQGWPDAPNHAGFPSIELAPGETYAQTTQWRFDRK